MNLQFINPPLQKGQQVQCGQCYKMSANAFADLDAPPFTFICRECIDSTAEKYKEERD